MSTQADPVSESELIQFMEKLAEFHESLSPKEQAMMDEMTAASMADEVSGFGFTNLSQLQGQFQGGGSALPTRQYYANVASILGDGSVRGIGG